MGRPRSLATAFMCRTETVKLRHRLAHILCPRSPTTPGYLLVPNPHGGLYRLPKVLDAQTTCPILARTEALLSTAHRLCLYLVPVQLDLNPLRYLQLDNYVANRRKRQYRQIPGLGRCYQLFLHPRPFPGRLPLRQDWSEKDDGSRFLVAGYSRFRPRRSYGTDPEYLPTICSALRNFPHAW